MGWGEEPHEGYMAWLLRDGRLTARWRRETAALETGRQVVRRSCRWQGGEYDDALRCEDPAEGMGDRAYQGWRTVHMAPLVDPDPDNVLTFGRDLGAPRHFLAGRG